MKSDSDSTCFYKGTISFVLSLEACECFQQPLIKIFTKTLPIGGVFLFWSTQTGCSTITKEVT
jgi:hypothetical protein